ncbi:MAG: class I SAM-dependent methyltransferase [Bacteroidales bacterium]|jgi:SAM-dependent methyltransferase
MMREKRFSESELVRRYKEQYRIRDEVTITPEMVLKHWNLERELTERLIKSNPDNRWEVFDYCYSALYRECEWLNKYIEKKDPIPIEIEYKVYTDIIGNLPKQIYEIGSGEASLISYLALNGHKCVATEISRERGEKHVPGNDNLTWRSTDGIHLERFEEGNEYDYVISNAVVEHLHPDDICDHFKGVRFILKPGGKYILFTGHKFYGPMDISRVFEMKKPMGMHLKEYMINELFRQLKKAGFSKIYFPHRMLTKKFHKYIPFANNEIGWVVIMEKILNLFPYHLRQKILSIHKNIFPIVLFYLIAEK